MNKIFLEHFYLFLLGYFIVITIFLSLVIYTFRKVWTHHSKKRSICTKASMLFFSLLYGIVFLEAVFAYAFIQPDGFGFTLSSRKWFYKYWNPINSYGYRDHEPSWKDKKVFITGDSFVAGHGITNIDNRFSNLLIKKLGDEWSGTILAQNGWNPGHCLNALKQHDKTPDVLIVSYFINDIQGAAARKGIYMPILRAEVNKSIAPFVNYSYMVNFLYWRLSRGKLGSDTFWNYLNDAYSNKEVWLEHTRELDALVQYSKEKNAKIIFVIWPNMIKIKESKVITDKVYSYLKDNGVEVINLTNHFEGKNPSTLIVNSLDAHPMKKLMLK